MVDLDGTLFKINTFHFFIRFYGIHCITAFKIVSLVKIVWILSSRLLGLLSHGKMKFDILKLTSNMPNSFYEKFVDGILRYKRSINEINKNYDFKILATAAPSCYAEIIARIENFDFCIATKFPNLGFNESFENIGAVKKKNVMNLLSKKGINIIDTVITDHIDDLPLMQVSKRVKVVNPNKKLISELNQHQISYAIIK